MNCFGLSPATGLFPSFRGLAAWLFVSLAVSVGARAHADTVYICEFNMECPGGEDCAETDAITLRIQQQDTGWTMEAAGQTAITLSKLPSKSAGMLSFLAENTDPAAAAVSILSIFEKGQAFMSTHGIFLTPGFVTHIGTCVQKDN